MMIYFSSESFFPIKMTGVVTTSWADWSNTWGREMVLQRALERLNLKYPANSN
jgi:hypothetical protein